MSTFHRYLICPRCGHKRVTVAYRNEGWDRIQIKCDACGRTAVAEVDPKIKPADYVSLLRP